MHRPTAVAGLFYPADPEALTDQIDGFLAAVRAEPATAPKALIAPHAGTVYSGPVAANAYALLRSPAEPIERVVLVGPSHRVPLRGLAVPSVDAFDSPLGAVPIDARGRDTLLALPHVVADDEPHRLEHSLEVHVPFLQRTLRSFELLPLAVGAADAEEVAEVLEHVWGGPETLVVISSDLSHFFDYERARIVDRETCRAIERFDHASLDGERACGYCGVRGLLLEAQRRGMTIRTLDLRNSGDTAGPRDRVVGYGSWALS